MTNIWYIKSNGYIHGSKHLHKILHIADCLMGLCDFEVWQYSFKSRKLVKIGWGS